MYLYIYIHFFFLQNGLFDKPQKRYNRPFQNPARFVHPNTNLEHALAEFKRVEPVWPICKAATTEICKYSAFKTLPLHLTYAQAFSFCPNKAMVLVINSYSAPIFDGFHGLHFQSLEEISPEYNTEQKGIASKKYILVSS